ncbi:helix-turn-helix domain-containing protein (plasmid) [Streptomyces sp. NBC_01005]|uniref:helix-turn-helix domain-containing protein n=1 Tax=Streptomyces sp. NBC_01005 TaxID=2903715 RepID=UPI002F90E3D7|nr:helix-turn-helix domain-containing protein [Streptomyces sp. NBC_01005]
MSIEAHNYVIKLKVGNLTAKFVLGRLADRADERYSCYPSIGLLAAEVEKSERTVQRALEFLAELRLVSDKPAFRPDGSQTSNRYFLHGPWDDYAGTGVPFPEIVTPKEARATIWAQGPAEAEFRAGSAAAAALKADAEAIEASKAAAEAAAARAEAVKEAQRERGRKAAASKPYSLAKRPRKDEAGSISAGEQGVTCMSPSPLTCMSPPGVSLMSPLEPSVSTHSSDEAVSPRSGGDGRSPSTSGSSAREAEGGFAASGKTSPSPTQHDTYRPARGQKSGSKRAAHTRDQLDVVRRVRALFPRELLDAAGGLPDVPTLSSAILTAMGEGRTVEQMGERIWYRWSNHGFADQWAEIGRFEKPVGVAVALVRPLRRGDRFACPDLRCEAGASLDTGAPCVRCEERIADWKAEQARKYGPKPSGGANSGSPGTDSPDAPVPPQRAVQPPSEPRSTESWAAQARAEEAARKKGECDGRDGMCGRLLAPGRSLCGDCKDEAAEQYFLENKGLPAPF